MAASLLFPSSAKWRALSQTPALLILGQGFTGKAEFIALARRLTDQLLAVPGLKEAATLGSSEGSLAVFAEPCIGKDLGFLDPAVAAPRLLRLRGSGEDLQAALDGVALTFMPGFGSALPPPASSFWSLSAPAGRSAKLVAVLRKPPGAVASPAEYYKLPVVAVDAVEGRAWHLVVIRALAQVIGGLGDEFTRRGPDWETPPQSWTAGVMGADTPHDIHRLGRNLIIYNDAQGALLGQRPVKNIFYPGEERTPDSIDPAWIDECFPGPTPFRPAHGASVGADDAASVTLAQGGGGFRAGVLRCDQPCLMAEVPAEEPDDSTPLAGTEIGTSARGLCSVCTALVSRALGRGWGTLERRRGLDRQNSKFNGTIWEQSENIPVVAGGVGPIECSVTMQRGAIWSFMLAVTRNAGLTISDLKLKSRPNDPMAASEDVMQALSFGGIAIETADGRRDLIFADAFDNADSPPRLRISKRGSGPPGHACIGARLSLEWRPGGDIAVCAEMSLVCRTINNDFDPGRAAEACKFYPEINLSWVRLGPDAPREVRHLSGTVSMLANNRMLPDGTDHDHDHGDTDDHGMVFNSQSVMLLADSNSSKKDGRFKVNFLQVGLIPVPVSADWTRGRLLGAMDTIAGVGAWTAWQAIDKQPLLPEWSWLFDYGLPVPLGEEVSEVVVWDEFSPRGATARDNRDVVWPPNPDPALPGTPTMHVHKLPRQGAYDNIHVNADMGVDSVGRPIIAAPFCADLCLHLHFRWGTHAVEPAADPVPFLGWSDGPHATSYSSLGAPLVPPNQRITLKAQRVDAKRTQMNYAAEIVSPREGRNQVILEQGIGFAFTYGGLRVEDRAGLALAYGELLRPLVSLGFVRGDDAMTRQFFRGVYERIRWLTYGFAGDTEPQQIPTEHVDVALGPSSDLFRGLVEL